ncbi:hypothetical protein Acr_16g0001830 [Actinidia rufa]|uniref:Transmembrane protein n=1 Tax=Actinidia rufa TaxID=165716 RepID=A0A7J0FXZ3_9ERIC|nr:hypothetical protein Acr_16g0001830 [Actinidia rufa]
MEEEGEEREQVSEDSRSEWEAIHYPHPHPHPHHLQPPQTHHRSLSDSQTQYKGWSMVTVEDDRSFVFPPVNHEGLHLSSTPSSSLSNRKSSDSPSEENGWVPPHPAEAADAGSGGGGEVARWAGLGFELFRDKVSGLVSSIRYFVDVRGASWSFCSATGVATAVLAWWLFVVIRRRRRRLEVRSESRDHLILFIKEKDEVSYI